MAAIMATRHAPQRRCDRELCERSAAVRCKSIAAPVLRTLSRRGHTWEGGRHRDTKASRAGMERGCSLPSFRPAHFSNPRDPGRNS
jgi:hypothetical protein